MSRPAVTDEIVDGLGFARSCVLDQRISSHSRGDHSWDEKYREALAAIDSIVGAHKLSMKSRNLRPPSKKKLRSK